MDAVPRTQRSPVSRSRAEGAAGTISELARYSEPGARLGSRADLKELCGVSVGTLHEALRLLQSTGEIVVRTGPGGGIFAGESSPLADLVRSVQSRTLESPSYAEVARVTRALNPLILEDAIAALDADSEALLAQRLEALTAASHGDLRDFTRASLELFSTITAIPPNGVLRVIAGSILRAQMDVLRRITGAIDPDWREVVDQHRAAVADVVSAILARDVEAAVAARSAPELMRLFEKVAAS